MKPYVANKDELTEYESPPPFARFAKVLVDPDHIRGAKLSIGVFRYAPGQVGPAHTHKNEVEVYYVLRGRGTVRVGDETVEMREGTAVYVPETVEHETRNTGDGELEFLGIFAPAVGLHDVKERWTARPPRKGATK
ncbi:MAG: cupin domain-containing protein [Planctomycetota bacterium]